MENGCDLFFTLRTRCALLEHSGSKPAFVADTYDTTDLAPDPAVTNVLGAEGSAPIGLELERLRAAYQSDTNVRLLKST